MRELKANNSELFMTLTIDQKKERSLIKQRESKKRQIERQKAKLNDPEYRAKKLEKRRAQADRAAKKRIEKLKSPEYQKEQQEKQKAAQARALEKQKAKQLEPKKVNSKKKTKPVKSKGLKGRTPTAAERKVMDMIGALPCLACMRHGRINYVIALHHIDGRVKEHAHAMVLPLCAYHHDTALERDQLAKYPDMVPIHAKGSLGGKAQWRNHNGNELEMLSLAYAMINTEPPFELPEIKSAQYLDILAA